MYASWEESETDGSSSCCLFTCARKVFLSRWSIKYLVPVTFTSVWFQHVNVKVSQYPFVSSHCYKNRNELNASASVQFKGLSILFAAGGSLRRKIIITLYTTFVSEFVLSAAISALNPLYKSTRKLSFLAPPPKKKKQRLISPLVDLCLFQLYIGTKHMVQ